MSCEVTPNRRFLGAVHRVLVLSYTCSFYLLFLKGAFTATCVGALLDQLHYCSRHTIARWVFLRERLIQESKGVHYYQSILNIAVIQ